MSEVKKYAGAETGELHEFNEKLVEVKSDEQVLKDLEEESKRETERLNKLKEIKEQDESRKNSVANFGEFIFGAYKTDKDNSKLLIERKYLNNGEVARIVYLSTFLDYD